MNTAFILNHFEHLRKLYSTEKEFTDHLLSGEVTISIPDLLKLSDKYEKERKQLPSQHQVDDEVLFILPLTENSGDEVIHRAEILAVHFYRGKVKYDLDVSIGENITTRMYNIDSVFVLKRSAMKLPKFKAGDGVGVKLKEDVDERVLCWVEESRGSVYSPKYKVKCGDTIHTVTEEMCAAWEFSK